jgi:hypothetical protein
VHLYEALPGAQRGHLAASEATDGADGGGGRLSTDEFEDLTPETAALLVGQPGLGRHFPTPRRGRPLRAGQRLFRVVVPGMPGAAVRRRRPRLVVRLDPNRPKPALRVHLRLTEQEGDTMAQRLGRQAHPEVMALVRGLLGTRGRRSLAERLERHARRVLGRPLPAGRGAALANHLAETMLTTLAKQLPTAAAALASAARDPAPGLTLTFAFAFADRAEIARVNPEAPSLTIRPGHRRD